MHEIRIEGEGRREETKDAIEVQTRGLRCKRRKMCGRKGVVLGISTRKDELKGKILKGRTNSVHV